MFGMLYTMKDFVRRISPTSGKDGFIHYTTGSYKLHSLETLTGVRVPRGRGRRRTVGAPPNAPIPAQLRFVMCTDLNVGNVMPVLRELHQRVRPAPAPLRC